MRTHTRRPQQCAVQADDSHTNRPDAGPQVLGNLPRGPERYVLRVPSVFLVERKDSRSDTGMPRWMTGAHRYTSYKQPARMDAMEHNRQRTKTACYGLNHEHGINALNASPARATIDGLLTWPLGATRVVASSWARAGWWPVAPGVSFEFERDGPPAQA